MYHRLTVAVLVLFRSQNKYAVSLQGCLHKWLQLVYVEHIILVTPNKIYPCCHACYKNAFFLICCLVHKVVYIILFIYLTPVKGSSAILPPHHSMDHSLHVQLLVLVFYYNLICWFSLFSWPWFCMEIDWIFVNYFHSNAWQFSYPGLLWSL